MKGVRITLSSPMPDGFPPRYVRDGKCFVTLTCPTCQTPFERTASKALEKIRANKTQYCSGPCRSKAVSGRPEQREMARQNMIKISRGRVGSWNSGIPWSEAHLEKMSAIRKGRPFPVERGGNGKGPSRTEAMLIPFMPDGFSWNCIVRSEAFGQGCPSHYKLDFGNPKTKVCLEVDGIGHNAIKKRDQDRRKTAQLELLGWKVFRITNDKAWSLFSTSKLQEHLRTLLTECSSTTAPS